MAKPDSQRRRKDLRRMASVIDDLFANDKFINAVVEAHNNEQSRAQYANPRAFFQGNGSDIPSELDLEFIDETPPRLRVSVNGDGVSVSTEIRSGDKPPSTDPKAVAEFRRMGREARRVITSDAMVDVAEDAIADAELLKQFSAAPKAYLLGKGIRIPDKVNFEVTAESNPQACVCWEECTYWSWCWQLCCMCWNTDYIS